MISHPGVAPRNPRVRHCIAGVILVDSDAKALVNASANRDRDGHSWHRAHAVGAFLFKFVNKNPDILSTAYRVGLHEGAKHLVQPEYN